MKIVLLVCLSGILLATPAFLDAYWLRIATGVLMWAGVACSWNVIGGYAGYIDFGHSAFFGIGAYATAILMGDAFGWSFATTIPVGIVAATGLAALIGGPTLKLRGAYFAIATWAFAETLLQLAMVLEITGGTAGLSLPPFLDEHFFYYSMLAATAGTYALTWLLFERSRFGFKVKALRDHEPAAEALGINTAWVKLQAFALSAAMAAVFGSLSAYWVTFINPRSTLGGDITDQMVVMVLLGGLGSLWGPALGATALFLLNRVFWMNWGDTAFYIALLGFAIIMVVLFLPNGLIGVFG
ncbi:MAG: branched-chain amino acid ABC transporter permease, partial [Geminicoccales bacterium]